MLNDLLKNVRKTNISTILTLLVLYIIFSFNLFHISKQGPWKNQLFIISGYII